MRAILDILPPRIGRAVAIPGLMVYLIGTLGALIALEPHVFQRFGSLGVAAAVRCGTYRLREIELNRQRTVERILHEYGLELGAMKEGRNATDIPSEGFVIDFLTEERNFDQLRHRAEKITAMNTVLLTLATLQWGFGDAILRWIIG